VAYEKHVPIDRGGERRSTVESIWKRKRKKKRRGKRERDRDKAATASPV
jgi:hypothetical protein